MKFLVILCFGLAGSEVPEEVLKLQVFNDTAFDLVKEQNWNIQEGRGHWAGDYTSPQSFMITFSYLLA